MPKAREQFAEFLDQDSLDRFGILYQTTSVGFGYGRPRTSRRNFSRPPGSLHIAPNGAHHHASPAWPLDLLGGRAARLATENHLRGKLPDRVIPPLPTHGPQTEHPTSPRVRKRARHTGEPPGHRYRRDGPQPVREYQPVHPFDYACRARHRTRLTQGRQAWPWNPWSFSAGDSHPGLATHVCILTRAKSTLGSPQGFTPSRDALLPNRHTPVAASSVVCLSPATLSARNH